MIKLLKVKLMSNSLGLLISGFLCFGSLFAQPPTDSSPAATLLAYADSLMAQEQYSASSLYAKKALQIFEQKKDWLNALEAYKTIHHNVDYLNSYQDAINITRQGLKLIPKEQAEIIATLNTYLGYCYDQLGQIFLSEQAYQQSCAYFVETGDTLWSLIIFNNLAIIYIKQGDYSKAIEYFENANHLNNPNNPSLSNYLYYTYDGLGRAYFHQGNFDLAQENYDKAKAIYDEGDGSAEYVAAEMPMAIIVIT